MALFLITLRALAPLFLLIVLGYALKRARVLHVSHVPILNGIVVRVTLPALIIMGLLGAPVIPRQAAALPLILLTAQAVTMASAWGIARICRFPRSVMGAMMLAGVFGNTGFLGYPMTLALYPDQMPAAILLDQFGMNVALYLSAPLLGAQFGTRGGTTHETRATMLRFLRSPLFLAVVLGITARLIPWPPAILHSPPARASGAVLGQCLTYLGRGTTPIVLLALGVALRPAAAAAYVRPLLLASTLKLLLCPALVWLLCVSVKLPDPLVRQAILSAAMPTSVMASVLAAEHDLEGDFAVSVVFASTLLAAATVPVLLAVLR